MLDRFLFKQKAIEDFAPLADLVWHRFEKEPERYRGVARLLELADPGTPDPAYPESSWPETNRREEEALRADLVSLGSFPPAKARLLIPGLASVHKRRRSWVWGKLGRAPLASALSPLGRLARAAARPCEGESAAELAASYARTGWEVDAATTETLGSVESPEDVAAIASAVRAVSSDFQTDLATRLAAGLASPQEATAPDGPPSTTHSPAATSKPTPRTTGSALPPCRCITKVLPTPSRRIIALMTAPRRRGAGCRARAGRRAPGR